MVRYAGHEAGRCLPGQANDESSSLMETSLFDAPDRGPWGSAGYPGNCTGHLVAELIRQHAAKSVADPCEGSGTTGDVCRTLGIRYHGFDLREGFDLAVTPLSDVLRQPVDLVFLHPPYFRIVRYSGRVWGVSPHPSDLSHEDDWERYLARLRLMLDNALSGVSPRGRLALLIGDVRSRGSYFSAQAKVYHWFGRSLEAIVIKSQHQVRSDAVSYRGSLIRIMHEYCLILRSEMA
jgi:hypothetical protein